MDELLTEPKHAYVWEECVDCSDCPERKRCTLSEYCEDLPDYVSGWFVLEA